MLSLETHFLMMMREFISNKKKRNTFQHSNMTTSLLKLKDEKDNLPRLAVIDTERCKPSRCQQECRKVCPVVTMGKECIHVTKESKQAIISESLCNGCGLCVKRCPIGAIQIERIPKTMDPIRFNCIVYLYPDLLMY
jgi:Fe-S-cluster-containing hydrogenase component 2